MKTKTLIYAGQAATFTAKDFARLMADEGVKYALDMGLFYTPRPMKAVDGGKLSDAATQKTMIEMLRAVNAAGRLKWNRREAKWHAEHPTQPEAKVMKTSRSKDVASKAAELLKVVKARKVLEQREAELKAFFLSKIGSEELLKAGNFMVVISDRTRTDIDRKALVEQFGEELVARFLKETHYKTVEVKTA